MEDVSIIEAKEHLEDLLARAANGDDVRITDPKLGTIKLQPVDNAAKVRPKRVPGRLAGKMKVPEGLFDPLPDDELKLWTGEES